MSYRILTKNGIENTNIDGARNYNFNAGRRSGIVKGALNQGNFYVSSSGSDAGHTVILDTCELRLCGHRVVIDEATYWSFRDLPLIPQRYSLVAQVIVDNSKNVTFDLFLQSVDTPLIQDNLDKTGAGTYQLEIGRYTQQIDGTITDVVRTADLITGGIGDLDGGIINIGNVVTNTLDAGMEAEVDVEERYNEEERKTYTDFTFSIPKGVQGEKGAQGNQGIQGETGNGISSITKTSSKNNVDTYTITFTSGAKTTFTVTNGRGITKIEKTSTSGLIDTYTITYNDATTSTFQVTNGAKGDKGDKGDKGLQGLGMYRTNTALTTSSTSVTQSSIATKPSNNWQAGDMILDPNGLVFVATAITSLTASTIPIAYRLSIKGAKGDKGDKGDKGESGEIYQTTGTSTTGAMSQNATTTELAKKFNSGYGTCSTASATSAKVVTIADTNWKLKVGTIIGVKFTNSNSASNVTLNVNNTGAKSIWYNNSKYTGNSVNLCGSANIIVYYMYDGTYWVWLSNSVNANTDTIPAISWTVSGTAAKTASYTGYQLLAKSYFNIIMTNANTSKTALTLNVNGKGAKPIYINGTASSATNYTLPAGSYIVYYDGTNYQFRTDGNLPASISGYGNLKAINLWTNPNPTEPFEEQTVTLSTSAYDFALVYYKEGLNDTYNMVVTQWFIKGYTPSISEGLANIGSDYASENLARYCEYVSDTSLSFKTAVYSLKNASGTSSPRRLVPIRIVGFNWSK